MKKLLLIIFLFPHFANADYLDKCVILPPAKPCKLRKCSLFTDVSFLYWQAKSKGLEYAITNQNPGTGLDGKTIDIDFKWEPAFRLALGMYLPHDNWNILVTYTRFGEKSNHNSITSGLNDPISSAGIGIIPVWVHPAAFQGELNDVRFSLAKASWKINYNVIDADFGKNFCLTKLISIRPCIGIRNAVINQNFSVHYSEGNVITINGNSVTPLATDVSLKNFSYGIGPLFGLRSNLCTKFSLSIFTNLSLSLLHTNFDLQRVENSLSSELIAGEQRNDRAELTEEFWTYKPHAQLAAGIKWDKCIGCRKHLAISAAYEGNYWWKQNQMLRFIDAIVLAKSRNTIGDLYLQGLNLSVSLDY